jgi:uncharacterized protein (DUF924 family)
MPDRRTKIDEILRFWFGRPPEHTLAPGAQWQIIRRLPVWAGNWGRRLWDVDAEIRARFGDDLRRAEAGEYDDWAETPDGRLALILLLDQFSRNIHRGTPDAFAQDAHTLHIALDGIERGEDKLFYPLARSFFYLPLVHQEDLQYQDQAVAAYREAVHEAGGIQRLILLAEYCSALRHRVAIKHFGRFPHRNRILGRPSTPDERRFLKQPFSHF